MSHKIARFARFIGDFRYYLDKGYAYKDAWHLASMTMP
jgi:hypothetical protein